MTGAAVQERPARAGSARVGAARPWGGAPRRRSTEDVGRAALRRADEARVVLELARDTIARGWVQHTWHVTSPARAASPSRPATTEWHGPGHVAAACVVGALALAVEQRGARAAIVVEGGPAIDLTWDALQETRGWGGPGVAGRAAPREVRLARLRDLARWNDQPGRSRDEVLGLLDRAIARSRGGVLAASGPGGPRR